MRQAIQITPLMRARVKSFLNSARQLKLLIPTQPEFSNADGLPTLELQKAINTLLGEHRLTLANPDNCRLIRARGVATMALRREALANVEKMRKLGFWVCPVAGSLSASVEPQSPQSRQFDAVFSAIEAQCPRFFPTGPGTRVIPGGEMRTYSASEMKVYVLTDGTVLYKYYRAFNPVMIGMIADVLSGKARVDCKNIRGRSGLPWEREI